MLTYALSFQKMLNDLFFVEYFFNILCVLQGAGTQREGEPAEDGRDH